MTISQVQRARRAIRAEQERQRSKERWEKTRLSEDAEALWDAKDAASAAVEALVVRSYTVLDTNFVKRINSGDFS